MQRFGWSLLVLLGLVVMLSDAKAPTNPLDDDSFLFADDPTKLAHNSKAKIVGRRPVVLAEISAQIKVKGFNDKNPVDDLIDGLINDVKEGKTDAFGGAKATVLANSNVLDHKEKNNNNFMSKILRTKEEGKKSAREENTKTKSEATEKVAEETNKKDIVELKKQMQSEEVQDEKEEDSKMSSEEEAKAQEADAQASLEEKDKSTLEKTRAAARTKAEGAEKQLARDRAAQASKERSQEESNKESMDAAMSKAQRDRREEESKDESRQRDEEQSKSDMETDEQASKEAKRTQEEGDKRKKRDATGKHCSCAQPMLSLTDGPASITCPTDTLLTSINRVSGSNTLDSLTYLECCRPCTEDGDTRLQVTLCESVAWQASLSGGGWSFCPDGAYLQGVTKNGGGKGINTLQNGICCKIAGSRGRANCADAAFTLTAGKTTKVGDDRFIAGLKTQANDNTLNTFKNVRQCNYYSYL